MKIIAVAVAKGGVGKSMVTRSLATAAALAGMNVLAIDMDTQQTTTQWGRRRTNPLPLVRFSTENDLSDELGRARAAGCELVLIDTPPARSSEAPAAVEVADYVLIPCSADIEAFEQLPRTARLARTSGIPAAAILNLATPNSRSEEEAARGVFEALELRMAPSVLHRYKVHRDAARMGLSAQEIEPDSKAAAEIAALWVWICAELHISTSALVHKEVV
ncbi:MAG: chromosome partitioning protein ParA [Acidocella sp. 20-57-95]|nr:MAG: chromosome partitioning protein ParA [Acidocella sp. 20-57-95]